MQLWKFFFVSPLFLLLRLLNKFFVIFPLHFCTYFTPQNKISCLYRIFTSVNSCHVCETDCTFYDINTNIFLEEVSIIFHQIMHPLKSLKIDDFTSTISRLNFSLFFFVHGRKNLILMEHHSVPLSNLLHARIFSLIVRWSALFYD